MCNCLKEANLPDGYLAKNNARIASVQYASLSKDKKTLTFHNEMFIPLEKVDPKLKRKKLPTLFVTFCPLCGKKVKE